MPDAAIIIFSSMFASQVAKGSISVVSPLIFGPAMIHSRARDSVRCPPQYGTLSPSPDSLVSVISDGRNQRVSRRDNADQVHRRGGHTFDGSFVEIRKRAHGTDGVVAAGQPYRDDFHRKCPVSLAIMLVIRLFFLMCEGRYKIISDVCCF